MRCLHCGTEYPPQQNFCPQCGGVRARGPAGENPAVLIMLMGLVLLLAGAAFYVLKAKRGTPAPRRVLPLIGAVEHGKVATPDEFKASGRLYFAPIGRQVIPVQTLADYYQKKFNIKIEILPTLDMSKVRYRSGLLDWFFNRKHYAAESIVGVLRQAYPQIARDPDAVVIGLTDEDIYMESWGDNNFTYSYHGGYRFGVVSTHRMDPGFWGDPPDPKIRDASTRQMLTKYVAFMYFHVPLSRDPTSVMYQPLTPNGGRDDLYESDLHSEASANGLDGSGWPCISYVYSYATRQLTPLSSIPTDCMLTTPPPASPDEEVFRVELSQGRFVVHGMDLALQSTPPIEYRRAYISGYLQQRALGWGADVSFNTALSSDGPAALTYIDIVREDGSRDHLERSSPGRGFSPAAIYEGREIMDNAYGSRMTWDRGHFAIKFGDGSSATFLPCGDYRCFLTGYQDAAGNRLKIERGPNRELLQVSSQDKQGITFQPDDQHRIAQASSSSGNRISYQYNSAGDLVRVRRADGRTTLYDYDAHHNMTRVSVIDAPGRKPHTLVKNEYDPAGHLISLTLADGSSYTIAYQGFSEGHASELTVKEEPSGRILHFALTDGNYRAWSSPVQFAARRHAR